MTDDDSDVLARALADFAECEERERDNRSAAEDDIRFARLEEQWPEGVRWAVAYRECSPPNRVTKPSTIRRSRRAVRSDAP